MWLTVDMSPDKWLSLTLFAMFIHPFVKACQARRYLLVVVVLLVLCWLPALLKAYLSPDKGAAYEFWLRELLAYGSVLFLFAIVMRIIERVTGKPIIEEAEDRD